MDGVGQKVGSPPLEKGGEGGFLQGWHVPSRGEIPLTSLYPRMGALWRGEDNHHSRQRDIHTQRELSQ
jgi:threonyl-tRNA synthetase